MTPKQPMAGQRGNQKKLKEKENRRGDKIEYMLYYKYYNISNS